jgi:hypothetical protein
MIALLFAGILLAPPDPSIAPDAAMVARNLDLTTFPNSIGPRRKPGAKIPADYGFTAVDADGSLAILSQTDHSWEISVTLISHDGDDVIVCFGDDARNGGSYHAQSPLKLHHELTGLYRALAERPQIPSCPAIP